MRLRHVYLILCVVGVALPYWKLVPWLLEHGLDLPLLVRELFVNRVSGFFGLDAVLTTIALWVLVLAEGRRLGMRLLWMPVVASLVVGVSLGLPLFLYLRQRRLELDARG